MRRKKETNLFKAILEDKEELLISKKEKIRLLQKDLEYQLKQTAMYRDLYVELKNKVEQPMDAKDNVPRKQQLEEQLADINLHEKYPLCHNIQHKEAIFVEFFVNGKSIGKFTKDGAVDFAKKYLKQDYVDLGSLGTMNVYYEVKKIRKERETK